MLTPGTIMSTSFSTCEPPPLNQLIAAVRSGAIIEAEVRKVVDTRVYNVVHGGPSATAVTVVLYY